MLFAFLRRGGDLAGHLRRTKKVRAGGFDFEIRKVNVQDHLAGLNVILALHELYKREKPSSPEKQIEDDAKIRKFMRDFLYAGVASPKLSMKDPPDEGTISVDELCRDVQIAQALCIEILNFSYGKKN